MLTRSLLFETRHGANESKGAELPVEKPKNIADRVRDLLFDTVISQDCYLWDVEFVKEGADYVLRLIIDSNEGVTLDDCERVSRAVDPVLDEADPIESAYLLEVVSPGVERVLTRPDHYEACEGEKIEVRFYAPVDGKKSCTGILRGLSGDTVLLETPDGEKAVPLSSAARVSTVFDW